MTEGLETDAQRDGAAVTAVRGGDAERYRELVERHERRIYALAWSRLGDAALAEEVTQESFIRAYRRLWLLGDGAKFAAWISAIARRLAINLGLRHRRELDKRERWALEQREGVSEAGPAASAEGATFARPSGEALRRTLGDLSPAYRECLVLFYLEGQSGAEVAQTLGISESAFRVRLHRARAALRERVQAQLESSLAQLRPGKSLVPAIMAGVLAASSAQAAATTGVGAGILAGLVKIGPFKWAAALLPGLLALPMLLVSWYAHRSEAKNYRDQTGFRVRILRRLSLRTTVWVLVAMATILTVIRLTEGEWARERLFLGIGVFNLLAWGSVFQQTFVNRSRYQVTLAATTALTTLGCLLIGAGMIPLFWFNLFLGLQLVLGALVHGQRPARLDYNLFLRAREGVLLPAADPSTVAATRPEDPLERGDLLAFARFLGGRWLVDASRWTPEGLELRLPQVDFRVWRRFGWFRPWRDQSTLLLKHEGEVRPVLAGQDGESLAKLGSQNSSVATAEALELLVKDAVENAWALFRQGQRTAAEARLGQVSEAEVFVNPPTQSGIGRWKPRVVMLLLGGVVVALGRKFLL